MKQKRVVSGLSSAMGDLERSSPVIKLIRERCPSDRWDDKYGVNIHLSCQLKKNPFTLFLGCMSHFVHVRRLLSDTWSGEIKGAFSPEALDMCGRNGRTAERNERAWFCSETPERLVCSNNTTDTATGHKMTETGNRAVSGLTWSLTLLSSSPLSCFLRHNFQCF